ncbi:MAG: DMT family transporter [Cyanobacteria bacterium REEB459]|nr:DMT family transporter [Cyanobacteria bacterium REEB459]
MPINGELAALGAAFLWATATVMFGQLGKSLSPLVLNLAKGVMAIALILLTLLLLKGPPTGLEPRPIVLLILSGMVGIGLGDTAYFAAINRIGARQALLLETLAPAMTAWLAGVLLAENIGLTAWVGILLTLVGVGWVISQRLSQPERVPWQFNGGVIYAVLAALGQATGAVLSRAALAQSAIHPLWSSLLRLGGGGALILMIVIKQGGIGDRIRPLQNPRILAMVGLAALLGTYLAIYLQQFALQHSPAGVAQALTSTSPLFVLPMAAALGDPVSGRTVAGVGLALVGVYLLFQP